MTTYVNETAYLKTKCDFIQPFLKDKNGILARIKTLCIQDLDPNKVSNFKSSYENFLYSETKKLSEEITNQNLLKTYGRTLEDVKEERRNDFDQVISNYIKNLLEARLKAFFNNKVTFLALNTINIAAPKFPFMIQDFKGTPSFGKDLIDLTSSEQQAVALSGRLAQLQKKHSARMVHQGNQRVFAFIEQLDIVQAQYTQLKLYIKLIKIFGKKFEELQEEDFKNSQTILNELLKEHGKRQEVRAQVAFNKLMLEEEQKAKPCKKTKSPSKSPKQTSSNKEKELFEPLKINSAPTLGKSPLSSLEKCVLNLAKIRSLYDIHFRILRWNASLDKIPYFEDFDFKNNCVVSPYKKLNAKDLQQAKECHNLSGIEKILSSTLKDTYSFPYEFTDEITNKTKQGLGLFAEKHSVLGKESGIVYVGIGEDNVIYHAHFCVLKEKQLHSHQIARNLDGEGKSPIEEKWELTCDYQFSVIEGDLIQMEVGKNSNDRVTYIFYPVL